MRKKKQPTADMLRAQLALAADEIIRLRTALDWTKNQYAMCLLDRPAIVPQIPHRPWWRRLLAWGRA